MYEVTGPRALAFAEAVETIGPAIGRPVGFERVALQEFVAGLRAGGDAPAELVTLLEYQFAQVLDGRNERTADGVRRALGRAPRDFGNYARRAARDGAWTATAAAF